MFIEANDLRGGTIGIVGTNVCATPGLRIRSGGAGRGLARGRGRGPIGRPGLGKSELVSRQVVARVKSAAAKVVHSRMLDRQREIARKLGLPQASVGLSGFGHILTTWQALKEGAPWTSPGAYADEHNAKHAAGFWPNLSQYDTALIEKVKKLNGLSQYEIEHMPPAMVNGLIAKARQGQNTIAPSPAGPPPDPSQAANAALQESVGGKIILSSEKIYDTAATAVKAPFEFAKWLERNKKYLVIGGVGILGLIIWPYIQALRAPGLAMKKAMSK